MKVAIIHYWLVGMRGGERVLEAFCKMFPEADIFTHVVIPEELSPILKRHRIRTTFINKLPRARHWYNHYLPLMPLALEQIDLRGYDLVISSESGPAKGVITEPDALHLCYCHSPMRYLWDQYFRYMEGRSLFTKLVMQLSFHYLRLWDVASSARVESFAANSAYVAQRIQQYWNRDSEVIHPPVDIARFHVTPEHDGYYLWVGKIVRYKAPDLLVKAFNESGKPLVVVGDGEVVHELKKLAKPNIRFVGACDDAATTKYLERCRALIFPGAEDFGIVPVEAMACGKPVIAYGRGGATETVLDGVTGLFFNRPTVASLNEAIEDFEAGEDMFDPKVIRRQAENFSEAVFQFKMHEFIHRAMNLKFNRDRDRDTSWVPNRKRARFSKTASL
jgi:glycosyltransferase involved in cell wall biosynthesis